MPFFWRGRGHVTNRGRQRVLGETLERLEGRIVLSATSGAKVLTTLSVSSTTAEKGQFVPVTATVENARTGAPVVKGTVRFVLVAPSYEVLGNTRINKKGVTNFSKGNLTHLGVNEVQALYLPPSSDHATSRSAPQAVNVVPATVTSFAIVSSKYYANSGKPITFTVTALGPNHKPVTNFIGTIQISSPTDNQTKYSAHFYANLGISAPSPVTTGLADIPVATYTFKPGDHGSHTFTSGITFHKGGAQVLMVTQTDNNSVHGTATYGIS
jgi:hypothetical protein